MKWILHITKEGLDKDSLEILKTEVEYLNVQGDIIVIERIDSDHALLSLLHKVYRTLPKQPDRVDGGMRVEG